MSVAKGRHGGWDARWREGGRSRQKHFTLKADADAWDRDVKRRQQLGPLAVQQLTNRDDTTLDEWIVTRWAPEYGRELEQRTRDRYASSYGLHVQPWLGSVPLNQLTVGKLREWQAGRLAAGASPETILKARVMLSSVLRHAAESQDIAGFLGNPLYSVRPPKPTPREATEPLSPERIERVRAVLAAPMPIAVREGKRQGRRRAAYDMPDQRSALVRARDAVGVSLLAYAGLRPSELHALRWSDVREQTITVQRATNPDGSFKTTKNRQRRSTRVMAPLAQDLREYRLVAGRPPEDALVFPRTDGQVFRKVDWDNWRSRTWNEACRRAGVRARRPYDLRHSPRVFGLPKASRSYRLRHGSAIRSRFSGTRTNT